MCLESWKVGISKNYSKIKEPKGFFFHTMNYICKNEVVIINKIINFAAIGGDLRQIQVINSIAKMGHQVSVCGFEKCKENFFLPPVKPCDCVSRCFENAEIVILPLPYTTNGITVNAPFCDEDLVIENVITTLKTGQKLFVGKVDEKIKQLCETYSVDCVDYFDREELTIANAIPTVEGAIMIAMRETPFTLHGSNCLCLGFGRIGKILSKMLAGIGANVSVAARKPSDFAWINAYDYTSLNIGKLEDEIGKFDIIFNTVPRLVLDFNLLSKMKKDVLVIDLASRPGGTAFDVAKQLGINAKHELSLPGRVAPQTAGKIIANTILNIIESQERS